MCHYPEVVRYAGLGLSPCFGEQVAFLDVYLDESFGPDKDRLVAAGFVSSIDRWAVFSSVWRREVLDKYKIPYLHMSEFRHPDNRHYRHLSQSNRAELLSLAIKIISDHVDFSVISDIRPSIYKRLTTPEFRSQHGTAYAAVVTGCIYAAEQHLRKRASVKPELNIYIEDGHANADEVFLAIRKYKRYLEIDDLSGIGRSIEYIGKPDDPYATSLGNIALGSKDKMLPLQAADLLAYSWLNSSRYKYSKIFFDLNKAMPSAGWFWEEDGVTAFIERQTKFDKQMKQQRQSFNKLHYFLRQFGGFVRHLKSGYHIHTGDAFAVLPAVSLGELMAMSLHYDIKNIPPSEPVSQSLPVKQIMVLPDFKDEIELVNFLAETDGFIQYHDLPSLESLVIAHSGPKELRVPHAVSINMAERMIDAAILQAVELDGKMRFKLASGLYLF